MQAKQKSSATARVLRLATVIEIVFLSISAFFLFTEHRAHFLGALPYALLVVAITASFWFVAERRKHQAGPEGNTLGRPGERK